MIPDCAVPDKTTIRTVTTTTTLYDVLSALQDALGSNDAAIVTALTWLLQQGVLQRPTATEIRHA
jgi:hypothetical protein